MRDGPKSFMEDCASRISSRVQITTDGHRAYLEAVEGAFGMDAFSLLCGTIEEERILKHRAAQSQQHLLFLSVCFVTASFMFVAWVSAATFTKTYVFIWPLSGPGSTMPERARLRLPGCSVPMARRI
jgi:hypothetical protein